MNAPQIDRLESLRSTLAKLGDADKLRLIDFIADTLGDPDAIRAAVRDAAIAYAAGTVRDFESIEAIADDITEGGPERRDRQLRHALNYRVAV